MSDTPLSRGATSETLTATYDPEVNALYVKIRDLPVVRTIIHDVAHTTDIAAGGHIVGHEFLLDKPLEILR